MSNHLNVTIASSNPPLLDVEDRGGQNKVSKHPQPQTIKWQLTGEAARGSFLPMSGNPPGFSWISNPPPQQPGGPFGIPVVGTNGNSLTITDDHTAASSDGTWIYMLRVQLGDVVFTTTARLRGGEGIDNPIIINR